MIFTKKFKLFIAAIALISGAVVTQTAGAHPKGSRPVATIPWNFN